METYKNALKRILKPGVARKAIANYDKDVDNQTIEKFVRGETDAQILFTAFSWNDSKEGADFWNKIHKTLMRGENVK